MEDDTTKKVDWHSELIDQLDGHWQHHLRPKLDGLTDDEYFWEPVPGCWSLRPRDQVDPAIAQGSGDWALESEWPPPEKDPPVTTIAWRMGHVIAGLFGYRNASHFGGTPAHPQSFSYPITASAALDQLDSAYATWLTGLRGLGLADLSRPCGPSEGPWADSPLASMVLHINREVIHHGAEITLLRDLYRTKGTNGNAL